MQRKGHAYRRSEEVRNGLGENYSVNSEETRQKQYQRNEADAVAQTCKRGCRETLSNTLIQHVGTLHEHGDRHCHALRPERRNADGDDLRVVAELPDNKISSEKDDR